MTLTASSHIGVVAADEKILNGGINLMEEKTFQDGGSHRSWF
jgi:hypothetical protein